MKVAFLISLAITASYAAPSVKNSESNCKNVMNANGLTARFPGVVAHAIHSLTLQDIRYYFEPLASSDIRLPTVNKDLSSDEPILFTVVDSPYNKNFETAALRATDRVLSHMDDNDYMAKGYSPLETLVHSLHMQEEWTKLSEEYKVVKENPPTDDAFCPCVYDIEANGVLLMLRHSALRLREPELMYGTYEKINDGYASINYNPDANLYKFNFIADFNTGLVEKEDAFPRLDNSAAWSVWKRGAESRVVGDFQEAALFLYCVLN